MKNLATLLFLTLLLPTQLLSQSDFITTWRTRILNESITIPTKDSSYNYTVNWGDGSITTGHTGDATHTYTSPGVYTVSISDTFPRIHFEGDANARKIIAINQWGTTHWTSMAHAFFNCIRLEEQAIDTPDLSMVSSMDSMFYGIRSISQSIESWDVSNVTSMISLFQDARSFNQDIGTWNVSHVLSMKSMFSGAGSFNQDIEAWNVGSVLSMKSMFSGARSFNQDIGTWDVSRVTDMNNMFYDASSFNQDIGGWDMTSLTDIRYMLSGARSFNYDVGAWDLTRLSSLAGLFDRAYSFNQDVSVWDMSAVTDMSHMFSGARSFNYDVSVWDVSNVTDMSFLFQDARVFNYDIEIWDVGNVIDMSYMLAETDSFNQNLGTWDLANVRSMAGLFASTYSFDQDMSVWDVSEVTDMSYMFSAAHIFDHDVGAWDLGGWDVRNVRDMRGMFRETSFNQDIGSWEVADVGNMESMFAQTTLFNQAIGSWDVGNVISMRWMFQDASVFNQDIGLWDVENVTSMYGMFMETDSFDQYIGDWDVANVLDMGFMFFEAALFNQDIGTWDVGSVTNMFNMFESAILFDQDIGTWDVDSVLYMNSMFQDATSFNQNVGDWDVGNVQQMQLMFRNAVAFDQDIGDWNVENVRSIYYMFDGAKLSTRNYDSLLIGWNRRNLKRSLSFSGGNSTYCTGEAARANMINSDRWRIQDAGKDCSAQCVASRVSISGGDTTLSVCIDGIPDMIYFVNTGTGNADYTYIFTDDNDIILYATSVDSTDFEGLILGVSRVYGLSHHGRLTLWIGAPISFISTEDCEQLSLNYVDVETTTNCGSEVCDLDDFMPGNSTAYSVWLHGIASIPGDEYSFDAGGGTMEIFNDGTAHITGRIVLKNNANYKWDVDVWLANQMDWTAWSALGRGYGGTRQVAINNHTNWDYWELDPSRSVFTGVAGSSLAGQSISLTERPANFWKGFQKGTGANDKNGLFGMSGWFFFSGSYSGYGDFNTTTFCHAPPTLQPTHVYIMSPMNLSSSGDLGPSASDPEGTAVTFSLSPASSILPAGNPQHGRLRLQPDGKYVYTPNHGYMGRDMFRFRVTDGGTPPAYAEGTVQIQMMDPIFLPVTLMSFEGEKINETSNKLSWTTVSERNTSHFELEKSFGNVKFQTIINIQAAGNSNQEEFYNFTDSSPMQSRNFYRLKLVDLDGKYSYSDVVEIKSAQEGLHLSLYPNPAKEFVGLALEAGSYHIQLTDLTGRIIKKMDILHKNNSKYLNIPLEGLPTAVYLIRIVDAKGASQVLKFVKK